MPRNGIKSIFEQRGEGQAEGSLEKWRAQAEEDLARVRAYVNEHEAKMRAFRAYAEMQREGSTWRIVNALITAAQITDGVEKIDLSTEFESLNLWRLQAEAKELREGYAVVIARGAEGTIALKVPLESRGHFSEVFKHLPTNPHINEQARETLDEILLKPENHTKEVIDTAIRLYWEGSLDVVVVTNIENDQEIYVASNEMLE